MTGWVPVARSDELAPGEVIDAVDLDELVVWRAVDGTPCVMEARCPHQWSHLAAEGAVDGDAIICTSHWWRFRADGTGSMLRTDGTSEPRPGIEVHPCVERDGRIWIEPGPHPS